MTHQLRDMPRLRPDNCRNAVNHGPAAAGPV